jgi:glutathionyl-hydroquinone reductase
MRLTRSYNLHLCFKTWPGVRANIVNRYPTIARFDVAYHTTFKCNIRMIRHDYPNLQKWYQHIYYDQSPDETRDAFGKTTYFEAVSTIVFESCCAGGLDADNDHRSSKATQER